MAISEADLWPAQLPVCPSSARNRGFNPSILGQIQRDISGAILRLPQSYPVYRVVSSRLGPGLDSDKRQWVSLPTKVNHWLSHIGNVRGVISTTRRILLRLAPPAA